MMKLETLSCNHCGGPLNVPESANFVTCNHCATQLAIRRTASTTFTEQLGEIRSNQQQMMEQLAQLERQNRLEQIDREWEQERQRYLTTNKNGHKNEPNEIGSIVAGIVMAIFGFFWTLGVPSHAPLIFPAFGVLFMFLGIGGGIYGAIQAKKYRAAQRGYLKRKSDALGTSSVEAEQIAAGEPIPTPEEYLHRLRRDENV